jgi:cystathionine beta-lyase
VSDEEAPLKPDTLLATAGARPGVDRAHRQRAGLPRLHRLVRQRGGDRRRQGWHGRYYYGQQGLPNQWALAEALTALEPGAGGTMLYPTGLSAVSTALLTLLSPGDELLMVDSVYGRRGGCATAC